MKSQLMMSFVITIDHPEGVPPQALEECARDVCYEELPHLVAQSVSDAGSDEGIRVESVVGNASLFRYDMEET